MGTTPTYVRFPSTSWSLFEDLLKTRLSGINGAIAELQLAVVKPAAAGKADSLATKREIDGVEFDGSGSVSHYGVCNTSGSTATKVVACTGFKLVTGAEITVRFDVANTAETAISLNVNNTGAVPVKYHGIPIIGGDTLLEDYTYTFKYNGSWFELVGSLAKEYEVFSSATADSAGESGLVPAPAAGNVGGTYLASNGIWSVPVNTTYSEFIPASDSSAGTSGLVPAPLVGDGSTKFLNANGTWSIPIGTTYNEFTGASNSDDGESGLVPTPLSEDRNKFLKADGTWSIPTDTTYVPFVAATASTDGESGLVPAPAAGDDATKFLNSVGSWVVPSVATHSSNGYMSSQDKIDLDNLYHKTNTTYSVGEQVHVPGQPNYLVLECIQAGTTGSVAPDFDESGYVEYQPNTNYFVGDQVRVAGQPSYLVLECMTAGTSGSTAPNFD